MTGGCSTYMRLYIPDHLLATDVGTEGAQGQAQHLSPPQDHPLCSFGITEEEPRLGSPQPCWPMPPVEVQHLLAKGPPGLKGNKKQETRTMRLVKSWFYSSLIHLISVRPLWRPQ